MKTMIMTWMGLLLAGFLAFAPPVFSRDKAQFRMRCLSVGGTISGGTGSTPTESQSICTVHVGYECEVDENCSADFHENCEDPSHDFLSHCQTEDTQVTGHPGNSSKNLEVFVKACRALEGDMVVNNNSLIVTTLDTPACNVDFGNQICHFSFKHPAVINPATGTFNMDAGSCS